MIRKSGITSNIIFRTTLIIVLLSFTFSLGGFSYAAQNSNTSSSNPSDSSNTIGVPNTVTLNMMNVDIRDILSVLAVSMNINIVYLENPVNVTFSVKDVAPLKALELLIQSVNSQSGQLDYIQDGNVIIVGDQQKLQKNFFDKLVLTRFHVSYITPDILSQQLDKLGIPVQKITLDKSSQFIWVQGTAKQLAKVASVIAALDRPENFDTTDGAVKASINLTLFTLNHITADRLEQLIKQLNIQAQVIKVDANPKVLWVSGSEQAMADVRQLVMQVDIAQSEGETFGMTAYNLKFLTYDNLISIITQLKMNVDVIRVGSEEKTLWFKGTQKDVQDLSTLVVKLDTIDNGAESQFFVYELKYVAPADAVKRLDFLAVNGVKSMALNYPSFSHELLVRCPNDMISAITRLLANLDVPGQKIKVIVDAAKTLGQITARESLINKVLDIPMGNMFISDNVSKDPYNPKYVIWVQDTPDNIKKIRDMIEILDSMTSSDNG